VNIPNPRQRLVHIHPGADELGRVYRPDLAINASSHDVAARLDAVTGIDGSRWKSWTADARSDYEQWIEPRETPGDVKLEQVLVWLRENLPRDAVITNGAGNYTAWVHRYYQYSEYRTQLAPTSGSMGYGVPAAVSAKLAMPERTVVCFSGDGCFQMHGQELGTAVQYNLPIIIVVANNGMYATIRMHQERHYPGRVNATNLVNPDFAALARAYGAHGERVQKTEEFPAAFERAKRADRPALIELSMDPEALSPRMTLSEARAAGEAAQAGETSDATFPAHGAG
jgi:acetolactate synthase-1/2/3 large subunit